MENVVYQWIFQRRAKCLLAAASPASRRRGSFVPSVSSELEGTAITPRSAPLGLPSDRASSDAHISWLLFSREVVSDSLRPLGLQHICSSVLHPRLEFSQIHCSRGVSDAV